MAAEYPRGDDLAVEGNSLDDETTVAGKQRLSGDATIGGPSIIEAKEVCHSFTRNGRSVLALANIDLSVREGEFVSIVGASGCGKTTFLNIVAGLEPLQSGVVRVMGGPPSAGTPGVGYAFARDALLPWRTCAQNVALPLEMAGVPKLERNERVGEMLEAVGLAAYANAYRSQLSQGMRQRVSLARVLVTRPTLLLMDEPFAALDAQTRLVMQGYLLDLLQNENATVLFVTHDLGEAIALSDRVVVIGRAPGRVKSDFSVTLPRPRNTLELQSSPEYHGLYERIWQDLGNEVAAAASVEAL